MPTSDVMMSPGGLFPLNKALLDTDILSEIIKGFDRTVAGNATNYRTTFGRYTLSAISVMEVVQRFQMNQSFRRLQTFVASLASQEVLAFDEDDGVLAGHIAGELHRVGRPIGIADTMIAAIALRHQLELVTGNVAHFQYVQQAGYPLTLINWRL
jgi:tRNA(fMet)-specific endonuclease VapC